MRRLAPSLAAAALALAAPAARAEPFDFDLSRLGPPTPAAWEALGETPAAAATLAGEARQRFGILSAETALAVSSLLLQPASTTGVSGFNFALEIGGTPVRADDVGTLAPTGFPGFSASPWATRSVKPGDLLVTGIHVRKALPFSVELGGRLLYLSKTSYFAAQGEAKVALNEGFDLVPDVAVRVAYTKLFGQRDWNLGIADLDFMVSKRFGVSAVTSFTPYLAARFGFLDASSETIEFGPGVTPATADTRAAFPDLEATLYRTTLGVRMTAYAMSLGLETTHFGGKDFSGGDSPYPDFDVGSSFSWAFRFGFEF